MKVQLRHPSHERGFTLIAYLIFALIIMGTIAAVATYVIQNVNYGKRRQDFVNAYQFAQGGAVIACRDIENAFTNSAGLMAGLAQSCCGSYTTNSSSATQLVLQRSISSPFSNQTVAVQLRMTNSTSPEAIKVLATAAVGNSSQTVEINLELKFAFGAAIISTGQGSSSTSVSKGCGQDGNVVVDGGGAVTWIDGGILSNGAANTNQCAVDVVSKGLYGTASQIPDYTSPGSSDQLFNFDRFIAVADATPGPWTNHYPDLTTFVADAKTNTLEGIVVVDIKYGSKIPSLDDKALPNGINVRGTLVFNFCANSKGQNWDPLDKIVNTATMNINAANLSSPYNSTNPATYPTGYPPVYTHTNKNPITVLHPAGGFEPFTASDDLPALMYNNAILDMHGDINICGVVYSSSFMEIENKQSGATQYFRGALIGGGGIYVENGQKGSTSIVSYDPNALDRLATSGTRGKTVRVAYQR